MKIPDCEWKTKTPFASIRRIVQTKTKEIYKIKPGLYGLVSLRKKNEQLGIIEETPENRDTEDIKNFNHSYYQGMIVTMGNMKGFETFVPNQDRNKRFVDKRLAEIKTLERIPQFSFPALVQRSSTIDVIWFNDKMMPNSFFEVEHSTDIQNSILKFCDLKDFSARMMIVADNSRRKEFSSKMKFTAFSEIKSRVEFLDYESLNKQFEQIFERQDFETII